MPGLKLSIPNKTKLAATLKLNGSKSISNRVLMMQALAGKAGEITNLSNAQDTTTLLRLLSNAKDQILDAGDAGTTYRFMTAYLATRPERSFLTGSMRMLERPIGILVEALNQIGANIRYGGKTGYPPLQIDSPLFDTTETPTLKIDSSVSSQYLSALLIIAPSLPTGLRIVLEGDTVSEPYIKMTCSLMNYFGIEIFRQGSIFHIEPQAYETKAIHIESDWSAASYYYAMAALSEDAVDLQLKTLYKDSVQGDAVIAAIMQKLGVKTTYHADGSIQIQKMKTKDIARFEYDFTNCPDLAQTIAVVLAGLGVNGILTGLQTLKIKETDRIVALKTELEKLGAKVEITDNSLEIKEGIKKADSKTPALIATYKDHRMAMAFAPLVLKLGSLKFDNKEVVNKSYPAFWEDLKALGFVVK